MKRKSSVRTGPKMTPEERKLMEDVLEEQQKNYEEDMGVMMEKSKKAGKLLWGISCEKGFLLFLGIFCSVLLGTFFPLFALVLADAVTALNDLAFYIGNNIPTEANKAED